MSGTAGDYAPKANSRAGAGSFVRRRLNVTYTLGKDTFDGIRDTIILPPYLRMSAAIVKPGGVSQGQLQLRIFGLTLDHINKMAVLGNTAMAVNKGNHITVSAASGDDDAGSVIYSGTVTNAWPDFNASPEVCFEVQAFGAAAEAVQSIPPSSYRGTADTASIMASLATQMGVRFENNGVSVPLSNPYFPGSAYDQAEQLAKAAGIHMALDDGTLAIWPKGGSRGGAIPLVSAASGLIGYPIVNNLGIEVRTLFNPTITFGAMVKVQSILQPACGEWQVIALSHSLETETPGGAWFSQLSCARPGYL